MAPGIAVRIVDGGMRRTNVSMMLALGPRALLMVDGLVAPQLLEETLATLDLPAIDARLARMRDAKPSPENWGFIMALRHRFLYVERPPSKAYSLGLAELLARAPYKWERYGPKESLKLIRDLRIGREGPRFKLADHPKKRPSAGLSGRLPTPIRAGGAVEL